VGKMRLDLSKKSLQELLLPSAMTFGDFIRLVNDKDLAKLGDSITNFLYSTAKTLVIERATGCKISDSVLNKAYKNSKKFQQIIHLNGRRDILADKIEATILVIWLGGFITTNEIILVLKNNLVKDQLKDYIGERKTATKAFAILLDEFADRLNGTFLIHQE